MVRPRGIGIDGAADGDGKACPCLSSISAALVHVCGASGASGEPKAEMVLWRMCARATSNFAAAARTTA